jgi:N-sulfoglucosamine sulfohydrolase
VGKKASGIFLPGIFLLLLLGCAGAERREDGARNVLIFIADDLGEGDLSCYGHPKIRTPNIDRLAAEGARFDRAYLTISSCSPSRASILTGLYPHQTRAEDLHAPLPADQATLARRLRARGTHTIAVGKWHLGPHEREHWDALVECPGGKVAEEAVKLLERRPPGRPFFAWIAHWDPHRPYDEPMPEPTSPADVVVPPYLPDHPLIRQDLAKYYDEIRRFDRHVGEVVDVLRRQGELDRTIVIVMSDNGMPFPRAKTTLYPSGIRTPFIVRAPGLVEAGRVSSDLVSVVDLAPALLDPKPGLLPKREAAFAEANWHDYEQFTRAAIEERWLLVRNYYWDLPLWNSVDSIDSPTWKGMKESKLTPAQAYLFQAPRPFEELYDLAADPLCLTNVADVAAHREALNRLRTRLDNWRVETGDVMPARRTPDGWTREGEPLPHNQPWYDQWKKRGGRNAFDKF